MSLIINLLYVMYQGDFGNNRHSFHAGTITVSI